MTFRDLPRDVKNRSLTDPALTADVIDLILGDEARASGAIGLMLCDAQDRGLQPVVLTDVPESADVEGCASSSTTCSRSSRRSAGPSSS